MDFLEALLIWLASCFPFFIPLIVPVGSYGFYKHAARHTDGTDDIQNATDAQKGLMTAAYGSKLDNLIPAPLGTDGTIGRVLRHSYLKIQDGSNANTLKLTLYSIANGDSIAVTDNVGKDATTGSYTLSDTGKQLKIEAAGLSGNVVDAFGNHYANYTTSVLTSKVVPSANDIVIIVYAETGGAPKDITALVDTGGREFYVQFLYITDA